MGNNEIQGRKQTTNQHARLIFLPGIQNLKHLITIQIASKNLKKQVNASLGGVVIQKTSGPVTECF